MHHLFWRALAGSLVVGVGALSGCAPVPCIVNPKGRAPVVIDFGDDLSMAIDKVYVRDDPRQSPVVHGTLHNRSDRKWQHVRLHGALYFQAEDQVSGAPEAVRVDFGLAAQYLFAGAYTITSSFACASAFSPCLSAGEVVDQSPLVFGGFNRGTGFETTFKNASPLHDGICRTLVSGEVTDPREGQYGLRPVLEQISPPAYASVPPPQQIFPPAYASVPPPQRSVRRPKGLASVPTIPMDAWFEDSQVSVALALYSNDLRLWIHNLSDEPMYVDWDGLVWVDLDRKAVRLVRWGARAQGRGASPPPALIPPGTRFDTLLVRDDGHLTAEAMPDSKRRGLPFILAGPEGETQAGRTLGLYLPLRVGEVPHPLDLRYRILSLTPKNAPLLH